MYRVYAQDPQARINLGIRRRLAPLLGNDRRKIELMNGLLFSLPGTPVIYYGDEIGMGDNIYLGDRNGVRTPMQWSGDRNAGFSRANPQQLYLPVIIDPEYHYEAVNVEAQQDNPHSLLWWMKRLIALRKRYQAFGRGVARVPALRQPQGPGLPPHATRTSSILVVANLSRFAQYVELDLSEFRGAVPVELFGDIAFPAIGELPYFLTLGPHGFYWFSLEHETSRQPRRRCRTSRSPAAGTTLFERARHAASSRRSCPATSPSGAGSPKGPHVTSASRARRRAGPGRGRARHPADGGVRASSGSSSTSASPSTTSCRSPAPTGERADELCRWRPDARTGRSCGPAAPTGCSSTRSTSPGFTRTLARGAASTAGALAGTGDAGRRADAVPPAPRHRSARASTSTPVSARAVQQLGRRRRPGHPEAHPAVRAGDQPGGRAGPVPGRAGLRPGPGVLGSSSTRAATAGRAVATVALLEEFVGQRGRRLELRRRRPRATRWRTSSPPRTARRSDSEAPPRLLEVRRAGSSPPATPRRAPPRVGLAARPAHRRAAPHLGLGPRRSRPRPRAAHRDGPPGPVPRRPGPHAPGAPAGGDAEGAIAVPGGGDRAGRPRSWPACVGSCRPRSRPSASAATATTTSARCSGPARTSSSSTSRASRPARSASAASSGPPRADLAGMIRSFHYAVAGRGQPADPGPAGFGGVGRAGPPRVVAHPLVPLGGRAPSCGSYLEVSEGRLVPAFRPRPAGRLLDFFLLEKAIYELSYEANSRPDWIDVPAQGILDLLAAAP